jgi:hypothetical protein
MINFLLGFSAGVFVLLAISMALVLSGKEKYGE